MKYESIFKILSSATITILGAIVLNSCASTKSVPATAEVEKEAPAIVEAVKTEDDKEFERSIGTTNVTKDTFAEDKTNILSIIAKLDIIMKDFDYKSWLLYVEPESIEYWQKSENLQKAQNRLPIKGLRLRSLQDYFKYVFVPSRAGRVVSEIRYIDNTTVKAVQVQEDQDIIYYYFKKIDNSWMLRLPPIES